MKTTKLILALTLFVSNLALAQWQLTGNANTTTTSYLGTTSGAPANSQDVIFKRAAVNAGLLSSTKTSFGLNAVAMPSSASFGINAGQFSSGSGFNTYLGQNAGKGQSASVLNSGTYNIYLGYNAGQKTTTGSNNFIGGDNAGFSMTDGSSNVFIGSYAAYDFVSGTANTAIGSSSNIGGDYNVAIGTSAVCSGSENVTLGVSSQASGYANTFLGSRSGLGSAGNSNVFIGYEAGVNATVNNQLFIDNTGTSNPLIWGDFSANQLKMNGKVGVGSVASFPTNPLYASYKLFVTGGMLADEVRVAASASGTWADYVFSKDYHLKSLTEVESFIKENGHLPNVPSAAQVKEEGIDLGNMAKIQQEKIEELTLYIIELNKKLEAQGKEIEAMKKNK